MSTERDPLSEGFFSRWSRLKNAPAEESAVPQAAPQATAPATESEPPPLPPIEELTMDSDFRGFLHPKVDDDVRRAALRKLFSDPHFNVMDGLDVYIDDYSKADPIPPEMLAGLRQAQRIMQWAAEKNDAAPDAADPPADSGAEVAARLLPPGEAGRDAYLIDGVHETAPVAVSREGRTD